MSFAPRDMIAIQVEAHRGVACVPRAQGLVEENTFQGVDGQMNSRDEKFQCDPQLAERVAQTLYAHERAAALLDVERRRSDEPQSQYKV